MVIVQETDKSRFWDGKDWGCYSKALKLGQPVDVQVVPEGGKLCYERGEFIDFIVKNHSSERWISGTYVVMGMCIGVKAYGKWLQVMTCHGTNTKFTGVMGITTVKDFRKEVENALCLFLGV